MITRLAPQLLSLRASCEGAQQEGQGVRLGCGGGDAVDQPVGRNAGAASRRNAGALGRDPDARGQPVGRHARARRRGHPGQEEPLGRDPHARQGKPAPAVTICVGCRQRSQNDKASDLIHRLWLIRQQLLVALGLLNSPHFASLRCVCLRRSTPEQLRGGRRARRRRWQPPRQGRRGRGGTRRPPSAARVSARRRP